MRKSALVFIAAFFYWLNLRPVSCFAQADASETSLDSAFPTVRTLKIDITAAPKVPPAQVVLRIPAPPEIANPDSYNEDDAFRRALLDPARSDRWLVPTELGGIMLVVEKDYIDSERLDRLCADLQKAVAVIPQLTERPPRVRERFTVYVYDSPIHEAGVELRPPISQADVPGLSRGEKGLMLRFVKQNEEPLFHEVTHLLVSDSDSPSLEEGMASWVQDNICHGCASAIFTANADPREKCRAAFADAESTGLKAAIGAPRGQFEHWSGKRCNFDYCSLSFVDFLLRHGDKKAFWTVSDAGGDPGAYMSAYGRKYTDLINEWMGEITGPSSASSF